ncbi:MAG TPA: multicopper oxidase domain-containing protein [Terriglobia bacterium]|jgi:manganese oxidase|nr:multicopper oxidase domain-containing protein [Terriglobia bacterium]
MGRNNDGNDWFWLNEKSDKRRLRDAENARKNRQEIVRELSHGKITRRDLVRMGLFTSAGMLAPIGGLSPFVKPVHAQTSSFTSGTRSSGCFGFSVPTGMNPSPTFSVPAFSQPMPRFDLIPRNAVSTLNPAPTAQANTTPQVLDAGFGFPAGTTGPIEGRPPGAIWAHQAFATFPPQIAMEVSIAQATANTTYNPGVASTLNSGINPSQSIPLTFSFDTRFPVQSPNSVWTFNGTIPPKLAQVRYGEPVLFRNHNRLPVNVSQNNGFGRNTITTHEHNAHHGAENDGFTGAYFFPNQFYDYHWPWVLAGFTTINTGATDARAGAPNDAGGINKVPGDWHETMSTHWFHDHMFSFTAQNVYKGMAAMNNIYSSLDRGDETVNDGVNLRLASGSSNGKGWGNLDYDVNLMLADKAFDASGQLFMDIFDFDGFLGDVMTVNLAYKPYFEVERRRYRFRMLNASVSRFFKIALADASGNARTFWQIANDGNLLPTVAPLTQTDEMGIAERYDIIIDFANFNLNDKLWLVNLAEHKDGKEPDADLTLSQALATPQCDPGVGKFLEFRIVRNPAQPDVSRDVSLTANQTLIPNPDLSQIPVAKTRTFVFDDNPDVDTNDPVTTFATGAGGQSPEWGIAADGQRNALAADFGRVTSAPSFGTRETWTLVNGRSSWDHPIHIHFEEGQILKRTDDRGNTVALLTAEKGRKDVYRLRPGGSVTITMQFRDWGGMFMEHCHNTMHEDNAMLMRWEIDNGGAPFLRPLPTPIPSPTGVTFENPDDIMCNGNEFQNTPC